MLKKCTALTIIFLLLILNITILKIKNIFVIILLQCLFFSTLIYPMLCGLLNYKSLFYFFKINYYKCAKQGCLLHFTTYFVGVIFMIPFILVHKSTSNNLQITTSLIGGFGATLWLIFMSSVAFVPFWPTKKLSTAIKLSWQLSKQSKILIFILLLKTYLKFILIIPSPWALKKYIYNINKIKQQRTKQINQTLKYNAKNKIKFKNKSATNF